MRAWRRGPTGIRAADRPAGAPDDPSPLDLLLAAATAPAAPAELAGERAAVAAFLRARGDQARPAAAGRSVARSRLRRALVVKVAVGLSVAIGGGTAFAAQTARLPAGTQNRVHDALPFLAPPAPSHGSPAAPVTPSNHAVTAPSIAASAGAHVVELCLAWRDRQSGSPGSAALSSAELAELASAAGTQAGIPAFCDRVLTGKPGRPSPGSTPVVPTPAAPTPAVPTPSHPGGSPHPHPTPKR
jgi:hypothetical protein